MRYLTIITLCGALNSGAHALEVNHGTASGDVRSDSAVIWARCSEPARVVARVGPALGAAEPRQFESDARAEDDLTARVPARRSCCNPTDRGARSALVYPAPR